MKAFLVFAILFVGLLGTGCNRSLSQSPATPAATESSAVHAHDVYVCPMHPNVRSDKPGKCPICGMNLVKQMPESPKPAPSASPGLPGPTMTAPESHAAFQLSLDRQQTIGVKLGVVEKRALFREIRAPGRVAFDPELYTAQTEYLEALRQLERVKDSPLADVRHSASRMVESSKLRLKILGLSDKQIAALPASEHTEPSLLLHSAGQEVWVYAEVFEMDLPFVKPGTQAAISGSFLEGKTLTGKVVSVDRVLSTSTRTAKVRIAVPKTQLAFRPESYVDVTIEAPVGEQIAVPFDAILDSGKESWVFVRKPDGTIEPRLVTVKFNAGDWSAIQSGVNPGETIVTSANFLIDSESRLKSVTSESTPGAAPSCPQGQAWDVGMAMCMPKVESKPEPGK